MSREFHGTVTYPIDRNDSKVLIRIGEEEKPFWVPVTLQWNLKDLKVGDRVWIKANPGRFYWFVTEVALEPEPPKEQRPAVDAAVAAGSKVAPEAAPQLTMLPIERISGTLNGLKRSGDDPEIEEMAESAKTQGIIEPIIAMRSPGTQNVYLVVAGNRRVQAAQKAGLKEIPTIIRPYSLEEAYELSLIENIHRRDTSDYDKGRTLKLMLSKFPERYPNQEALAKRLGRSVGWISHHITAYEEAEKLKESGQFDARQIEGLTEYQIRELKRIPEEERPRVLESLAEAPLEGTHERPLSARRIAEKTGPEPIDTGEVWTCTVCQEKFRLIHYSSGKHKLAPEVGTNADSSGQPA